MKEKMRIPTKAIAYCQSTADESISEQCPSHININVRQKKFFVLIGFLGISLTQMAWAGAEIVLGDDQKLVFGGYIKADMRHVNGDIAYQDYWVANIPGGEPIKTSRTGFNVRESRINLKYIQGDITAFVEWDFYGGGGNEIVSNSSNDRLRHIYFTYNNWMVGQNWSTFMPLAALPEALDFGGPHVGEAFSRQVQIRYSYNGFQFALENPETNGDGDVGKSSNPLGVGGKEADADESIPDFVVRYIYKKEWGQLTVASLLRKVDQGGLDDTAFAGNISGRVNTIGKDDLRFQVSVGESGRYVSPGLTPDIVIDPNSGDPNSDDPTVEETTAFTIAYRHFWNEALRSTVYYGAAETDILGRNRAHWAINLLDEIAPKLTVGAEVGNYSVDDRAGVDADSNYLQLSAKYTF